MDGPCSSVAASSASNLNARFASDVRVDIGKFARRRELMPDIRMIGRTNPVRGTPARGCAPFIRAN